jgi:hypothetical protein
MNVSPLVGSSGSQMVRHAEQTVLFRGVETSLICVLDEKMRLGALARIVIPQRNATVAGKEPGAWISTDWLVGTLAKL